MAMRRDYLDTGSGAVRVSHIKALAFCAISKTLPGIPKYVSESLRGSGSLLRQDEWARMCFW